MFSLYEHQDLGVHEVERHWASQVLEVLYVSPTGSGKTVIAGHLINQEVARGGRALFIAGRKQIVEQTYTKLTTDGGLAEDRVSVLMGADKRLKLGAPVVVSCIDTLVSRELAPAPTFVIIDEAHQDVESYACILARWRGARVLGLTATPVEGLGSVFRAMVQTCTVAELVAIGKLAPCTLYTVPAAVAPDLALLPLERGDFAVKPTAKQLNRPARVGKLVEHWRKLGQGLPTVGFAIDIKHAEAMAASFNAEGITAAVLHSKHSPAQRRETLERFQSGEVKVLASCDCLSEGFDAPWAKCAILDRPTEKLHKYLQQAGRVLRPYQGQRAIIIDAVGNYGRHRLPTTEHVYTLTAGTKLAGGDRPAPLQTCEQCWRVFDPAPACPNCGSTRLPKPGKRLRTVKGQLVEVDDQTQRREPTPAEYKAMLVRQAFMIPLLKSFHARQAFIEKRMRERFGGEP